MPKYAVTRTWSVAGWVTTEIDADTEEAARAIEDDRWQEGGAVASLPHELRQHIEEIFEEIEDVRALPEAGA